MSDTLKAASQVAAASALPWAERVATWLGFHDGTGLPETTREAWAWYRAFCALALVSVLSTAVWLLWLLVRPSRSGGNGQPK
jgi:hypothetical protein